MNSTASQLTSEQIAFEEAIKSCDTTKIKKLLSCGFYVNQMLHDLPPLSYALSKGLFELVDILVSSRADVCQVDASGKFCPMYYAIKNKCPQKTIRRLVLAGAPVNGIVEYEYRSSALHMAVFANHKSVIKCLLSLSADIDVRDVNGMTPLHVAVQANHPKIVKMLALKGAKLEAECFDKFTPLLLAIHYNSYEMVALLISLKADVNFEPEEPKYSYQKPLNYAAGLGHAEIMRLLLKNGADMKPTSKFNESPLHSVALSLNLTNRSDIRVILRLLIEHGGDLDCYNNLGHNPLHSSIISKNTSVTKYLLKAGTSIEKTTINSTRDTPLHLAAYSGDYVTVRLLLNCGVNTSTKNGLGMTPYEVAVKQKDADTLRTFWSYGQPYDELGIVSKDNISGEIQSLINEQKKFFNAIEFRTYNKMIDALDNGAEVKARSLFFKYPLHFSVSQGHENIVHELLKRGVPVQIRNENGETALHVASKLGNSTICLDLLAHGACYNRVSLGRVTPYQLAKACQHEEVMKILKCIELLFSFTFEIEEVVSIMTYELESEVMKDVGNYHRLLVKATLNCVNAKGNTLLGEAFSKGFSERALKIMTYRLEYANEVE